MSATCSPGSPRARRRAGTDGEPSGSAAIGDAAFGAPARRVWRTLDSPPARPSTRARCARRPLEPAEACRAYSTVAGSSSHSACESLRCTRSQVTPAPSALGVPAPSDEQCRVAGCSDWSRARKVTCGWDVDRWRQPARRRPNGRSLPCRCIPGAWSTLCAGGRRHRVARPGRDAGRLWRRRARMLAAAADVNPPSGRPSLSSASGRRDRRRPPAPDEAEAT